MILHVLCLYVPFPRLSVYMAHWLYLPSSSSLCVWKTLLLPIYHPSNLFLNPHPSPLHSRGWGWRVYSLTIITPPPFPLFQYTTIYLEPLLCLWQQKKVQYMFKKGMLGVYTYEVILDICIERFIICYRQSCILYRLQFMFPK